MALSGVKNRFEIEDQFDKRNLEKVKSPFVQRVLAQSSGEAIFRKSSAKQIQDEKLAKKEKKKKDREKMENGVKQKKHKKHKDDDNEERRRAKQARRDEREARRALKRARKDQVQMGWNFSCCVFKDISLFRMNSNGT